MNDSSPTPRPPRTALVIVYATVFLDLLGFGIILPALPFYAKLLEASGFELGVLFTSYSLAQLVGAAVLGRLSDRIGRRPVLLLSLAGSAVSMVVAGLAGSLAVLYMARAAAGLAGGSISTAQAYIADVTRREERAKYMGLLGAAIGTGFVFGPALGALVLSLGGGFAGAAFTAAALAGINLLFAVFKLPESRPVGEGASRQGPPQATRWLAALGRPELRPPLLATFLAMCAFVSMETTFAYLGADCLGLSDRQFGLLLAFVGVVMILVQGGAIGPLTRRFGVRPVAVVGAGLMGLGLVLIALIPALACGAGQQGGGVTSGAIRGWNGLSWLALAAAFLSLLAVGQGFASPSLSTLLSTESGDEEQGEVLGVGRSLSAGARAFAPLLAGALYDAGKGLPFLAAAALALLAAAIVSRPRL